MEGRAYRYNLTPAELENSQNPFIIASLKNKAFTLSGFPNSEANPTEDIIRKIAINGERVPEKSLRVAQEDAHLLSEPQVEAYERKILIDELSARLQSEKAAVWVLKHYDQIPVGVLLNGMSKITAPDENIRVNEKFFPNEIAANGDRDLGNVLRVQNIFFDETIQKYFYRIQFSGFKFTNPSEENASPHDLVCESSLLYEIKSDGFHLVNISTDSELVRDLLMVSSIQPDFYTQEKYKGEFLDYNHVELSAEELKQIEEEVLLEKQEEIEEIQAREREIIETQVIDVLLQEQYLERSQKLLDDLRFLNQDIEKEIATRVAEAKRAKKIIEAVNRNKVGVGNDYRQMIEAQYGIAPRPVPVKSFKEIIMEDFDELRGILLDDNENAPAKRRTSPVPFLTAQKFDYMMVQQNKKQNATENKLRFRSRNENALDSYLAKRNKNYWFRDYFSNEKAERTKYLDKLKEIIDKYLNETNYTPVMDPKVQHVEVGLSPLDKAFNDVIGKIIEGRKRFEPRLFGWSKNSLNRVLDKLEQDIRKFYKLQLATFKEVDEFENKVSQLDEKIQTYSMKP